VSRGCKVAEYYKPQDSSPALGVHPLRTSFASLMACIRICNGSPNLVGFVCIGSTCLSSQCLPAWIAVACFRDWRSARRYSSSLARDRDEAPRALGEDARFPCFTPLMMVSYKPVLSAVTMDTGSKTVPTLCRSKTGLYETIINGVKQGNSSL
jgi:hypothetical protein